MSVILIVAGNPAPVSYAPTLLAPENGSYEDLSGTPSFQWQYNAGNPSSGTVQTHYQFQRVTNGGVTQYWNATSSTWQSTPVSGGNSGSTTATDTTYTLTFPSASFADGNVYQWTVATYDANGEGPFAGFFSVTSQALPTVTVSAPTGTITTADPIVTWSTTFPTGASQTTYQLIIYNASQYGAAGFTPGSGPSVYDTGVIGSSTVSSVDLSKVPVYLPNTTSYRAYVQVAETGGQTSTWAYASFTVNFSAPKAPTITVSAVATEGSLPYIDTVTQCHDNLLSLADSIPESGSTVGTWAAGSNTTLGHGTAPDGFFGLSLTATASGNTSAQTATGTGAYPVQPSTEYTATASLQAGSTGRTCTVGIAWYGSTGTLLSTSTGTGFSDSTASMTEGSVTATSPSNAAFAAVVVTVESAGASEVHWYREAGIFLGSDTTWGAGGFYGLQELILLRNDGLYVRGASIANPATVPAASQQLEVKDPEVYQQQAYTYTAQVLVTYGPNQSVLSALGTSSAVTLNASTTAGSGAGPAWIFNPLDPFNTACNAQFTGWNPLQVSQSAAHMVTGMATMNLVSDVTLNKDVNFTATTFDEADYEDLIALTVSNQTVFITTLWGANESGYFVVGPQSGGLSMGTGNRTKDTTLHPSVYGAGWRDTNITAVAQARPAV